MSRTNIALLSVLLAAALVIFAAVHFAPTKQNEPVSSVADTRPSPVAESVEVVTRTRRAPEPQAQPVAAAAATPVRGDGTKDWSVVAATLNSLDAAERRADSLKSTWRDCKCSVFPKGESERYFVVVATGLDRESAEKVRERATAAGLPGDTYVTKLIRRAGDEQP